MKKVIITLFIFLFSVWVSAQEFGDDRIFTDDATHIFSNFENSHSIGNDCGVDNFIDTNIYGDMNMNGYLLVMINAKLTIHGSIVNEGVIEFRCAESEIVEEGTLSVNAPVINDLKIFPIPTGSDIHISGTGIKTIVIYDLSGVRVSRYITPTTYNIINLDHLPSGIYVVKVNETTKKIIKK